MLMTVSQFSHETFDDSDARTRFQRVLAADRRDQREWGQCYAEHFSAVLYFVRRLMGREGGSTSEDLAQEAFTVAFATRRNFKGNSSVRTWICGIALNLVRRHLAHEVLVNSTSEDLYETEICLQQDATNNPSQIHLLRERTLFVLSCVAELPDQYLQPFLMCCIFGVNRDEAASRLGLSEGNLRVRIARAKAAIKQMISRFDAITDE
jgi:RNA polymerase sigma-70 factor (ECF subfamily)